MRVLVFPIVFIIFCWGILHAKSKFFLRDFDFETPQQELLTLFPEKKESIDAVFRETPFYTNIRFALPVKKKTLHKMFTDVPFAVKKAISYGYDENYNLKTVRENLHKISQEPELTGTIEMLMGNENLDRYIYLIKGTYKGFLIIRGEMIIDITIKQNGPSQHLDVKTYITLKNDIIMDTLKKLTFIPQINKKIEGLIRYNVNRIVKIGKKTAIRINREDSP